MIVMVVIVNYTNVNDKHFLYAVLAYNWEKKLLNFNITAKIVQAFSYHKISNHILSNRFIFTTIIY